MNAIVEIRFTPNDEFASNFIFTELTHRFSSEFPKKEETSVKSIPKEIQQQNPAYKYQPHFILSDEHRSIQIGPNTVVIVCAKPYTGWNRFRDLVLNVLNALKETETISAIERLGVRYTNLLDKHQMQSAESQFSQINCSLQLGSRNIDKNRTDIRCEFEVDDFIAITQIGSNIAVGHNTSTGNQEVRGLLVDIDIIKNGPFENFWRDMDVIIDNAHNVEKSIFFDIVKLDIMDQYD